VKEKETEKRQEGILDNIIFINFQMLEYYYIFNNLLNVLFIILKEGHITLLTILLIIFKIKERIGNKE